MKRVAGILAGCGFLDGAEIQEAVITLLAFERRGVAIDWYAPDQEQAHVVDHLKGAPVTGSRNVLQESARIVRGAIRPLTELRLEEVQGLVLPGGFGAAKNLCSFAFDGVEMSVLPALAALLRQGHSLKRPMGFICIAPVIAARVLGADGHHPLVTIGNHEGTIEAILNWGARHEECSPEEICVDEDNLLVSTPAWNAASQALQVEKGINLLAESLINLM